MEKIETLIAKLIVKITWFFTFLFPVNSTKITFISYYSNNLRGDFKLISNKLKERGPYKQVFLLRRFNNTLKDKFFYLINFILQTYHFNTSRIVVIDANNFVISNCRKKNSTKVVQLWHACGAIKKFGYDVNRRYKIKNYDYIFAAGNQCTEPFSRAFKVDKNRILPIGVARTDKLFNERLMKVYKSRIVKEYPILKNKKVILYAPTFRGDGIFNIKYVNIDLLKILTELGKDYVILYKLHPLLSNVTLGKDERIINVNNIDLYKAFAVTNILVSDYSAVIFDFSILEKPMIFYTPDLEQYKRERGFYYDYESFAPGPICFNEDEIIDAIKNNKFALDKVRKLKNDFFQYKDGMSTERITNYIVNIFKNDLFGEKV